MPTPHLRSEPTADRLDWQADLEADHTSFEAAQRIAPHLGAQPRDDGLVEVGFWTPAIVDAGIPESDVSLEIFTPTEAVDLSAAESTAEFERHRVPLHRQGEYHWGVIEGMQIGTRDRLGSLYQLIYKKDGREVPGRDDSLDRDGWGVVPDPLADSVPFGVYAPAECYDMTRLDADRADRDYFEALGTSDERVSTSEHRGLPRVDPAVSMLEIHPGTATESGSLAGLARRYEEIGRKQDAGEDLTPAERNFVGYDAIQLMPVEPLTQNYGEHNFWDPLNLDRSAASETVGVRVGRPDMINWGYDIVISAFAAPNPAVLETGRPDELVDFIATCHNLPDPIKIVFDIALGHADNGALPLLAEEFFEGPGMYGQHLDYQQPTVRAILLELQRRKMDYGADGIRVDGAQDFRYYDAERDEMIHDDEFLALMDEVTQEVAGTEYRPWMVYEDGRPWPQEDWELTSSYRSLIEQHPHSFQWSPVTFAHNTPALLTFWATKWWRVREVADMGSQWLTGVANHDTVRRGTQVPVGDSWNSPQENPNLADTLPETLDIAYNNPASSLLFHCMLPGVPMDFLNANMRGPWGFIRDTDGTWNVKVVAEEAFFVDWQLTEDAFTDDRFFTRLKALGFETKSELRSFVRSLSNAVDTTDYDLEAMAAVLSTLGTPMGDELSYKDLKAFGQAWMADVDEYANLSHWTDQQDDDRTAFDLAVRSFRHERPWLRRDIGDTGSIEAFDYRHPTEGTVLYYGLRESPAGDEQLLFAANMEGQPVDASPEILNDEIPELPTDGWAVALAAPGVDAETGEAASTVELVDSGAIIWRREP
jgi:hypothetical protein